MIKVVQKSGYAFLLLSTVLFSNTRGWAQQVLNGFIDSDITLTGIYIVETNVKVTKNATLVINKGSKIIFKRGTSIKIEGGLIMEGLNNKFIEAYSQDPKAEGVGFIITGSSPRPVRISYTHFTRLLIPITFESNWHRKKVSISNNLIDNINTGEPGVVVRRPDDLTSNDTINFALEYNNFVANNSSIWIDNFESDILHMSVAHNVIFDNYYYGYEADQLYSSPVNGSFNSPERKYKVSVTGNAIFGNFLYSNVKDTIIKEINFAVTGKAERFAIPNNYFGGRNKLKTEATLSHFSTNSASPYLEVTPLLQGVPSECHGFITKIAINNNNLPDWNNKITIEQDTFNIRLIFNRSARTKSGSSTPEPNASASKNVVYSYYDESKSMFERVNINCTINWDADNKVADIRCNDKIVFTYPVGYFTINGFEDNDGFMVPTVNIGRNYYQRTLATKIKDYSPSLRQ